MKEKWHKIVAQQEEHFVVNLNALLCDCDRMINQSDEQKATERWTDRVRERERKSWPKRKNTVKLVN